MSWLARKTPATRWPTRSRAPSPPAVRWRRPTRATSSATFSSASPRPWRRRWTSAARWSPRPAPASARPSPTWCRLLLSGRRALVSTATKSLQDQLFLRDLPRLIKALGVPLQLALLKGRASYLCLHRLDQARQGGAPGQPVLLPDRFAVRALSRIEAWAQATVSGDLAELDGLDERSPVIPLVTSTRENCLGSDCPQVRCLPCGEGAARGDGGRCRGHQPPPVLRRHGPA